jgi:subtilisin
VLFRSKDHGKEEQDTKTMKRAILLVTVMMAAVLVAFGGVALAQQTDRTTAPADPAQRSAGKSGQAVPGQYIVLFTEDVRRPAREKANEMAQEHGLTLEHIYEHAVQGFSGRIPEARLAAVRNDPQVQRVEQVRLWEIADDGMPTGVNRVEADQNTKANSGTANSANANKAVAIIDTGIYGHSDLDVKGGYNATGGETRKWSDRNGHGTHVAGTVGARDNGSGVLGVAPGADLYASKVCDSNGWCQSSWMVKGIDWVAGRKAEANDGSGDGDGGLYFSAANMSISTPDDSNACSSNSDAIHRAICGLVDKGVVFTLAAGNNNRVKQAYPEAVAVSALADFDGAGGLRRQRWPPVYWDRLPERQG